MNTLIPNTPDIESNLVNIALKGLSEKIRRYLSGECEAYKPFFTLDSVKGRLLTQDEDGISYILDPDFEVAYKDARNLALELKQTYPGLPKLPSYISNPIVGLQGLLEWCIDTSGDRADLPNVKTAETEQNTICAKIKAWLWKLYEKTVKAIVAAILEWWSKPK
jgi:hypothetical protein